MPSGTPLENVGKTLAGMQNRLKIELGNRTDLTPTLLAEWINDSYLDLSTSLDLPELRDSILFSTTSGEESYILPASVRIVTQAAWFRADTDEGRKLDKIDSNAYRKLPIRSGTPAKFLQENNILVLWPIPDEALSITLDYKVNVTKLTLPEHSPVIGEEFHEALYLGAKAKAFDALQNFVAAEVMQNRQVRSVRTKLDKRAEEDEGKTGQIRPVRRAIERNRLSPRLINRDGDLL